MTRVERRPERLADDVWVTMGARIERRGGADPIIDHQAVGYALDSDHTFTTGSSDRSSGRLAAEALDQTRPIVDLCTRGGEHDQFPLAEL
jgi:hypothetical protein